MSFNFNSNFSLGRVNFRCFIARCVSFLRVCLSQLFQRHHRVFVHEFPISLVIQQFFLALEGFFSPPDVDSNIAFKPVALHEALRDFLGHLGDISPAGPDY